MVVRYHIFVRGRVQGVFYRKYTERAAVERGVRGWVRNLPDGRVEVMAEGPRDSVESLVQWCHKGSPKSSVEGVDAQLVEENATYTFDNFEVRR
ncbi:putative Acylphosphatase [Trypanosoma vivax]|uniref:acylphosphatase n=1 Tax=Trypanosoma vivax (strain Y486) TaxID=1055687 RepID=G0TSM0_TRYVY|nr:putative Acylphosphatase [Trypanosoma vivax]CCC46947.1 putative acylphosphatase, fragment [Trypanosoma vivax Y486]